MPFVYVVRSGDSLWSIARTYEVSLDALRRENRLSGDFIVPGQELIIPGYSVEQFEGGGAAGVGAPKSTPTLPSVEGGFVLPEGEYSPQELEDIALLARLVHAEARGEPFMGQVAVAAVLLNRVQHPGFPDSVKAIIYQPRQFEPVANGTIYLTPNNLAYLAVLEALAGVDPTDGAVFFWNPRKVSASSWVWTQQVRTQIGDHVFA